MKLLRPTVSFFISEKIESEDSIVFSAFFRGENRDEGRGSEVLANDVSEFAVSPDENMIVYSAYSKGRIYLYDVQLQKSFLLANYREFFWGDSFEF